MEKYGGEYPNIFIEDSLGIYQPSFMYFYVNKNNQVLFDAIETGLTNAFADGSFKKLFLSRPEIINAFEEGKIKERKWYKIQNPFISEDDFSRNSAYLKSIGLLNF